jgi:hypothetical protein
MAMTATTSHGAHSATTFAVLAGCAAENDDDRS